MGVFYPFFSLGGHHLVPPDWRYIPHLILLFPLTLPGGGPPLVMCFLSPKEFLELCRNQLS